MQVYLHARRPPSGQQQNLNANVIVLLWKYPHWTFSMAYPSYKAFDQNYTNMISVLTFDTEFNKSHVLKYFFKAHEYFVWANIWFMMSLRMIYNQCIYNYPIYKYVSVVTCPTQRPLPGANLTCTDGNNFRSVCTFQCKTGYDMPPRVSKTVVCTKYGTWRGDGQQRCVGVCHT